MYVPSREHLDTARKIFRLNGEQFELLTSQAAIVAAGGGGAGGNSDVHAAMSALQGLTDTLNARLRPAVRGMVWSRLHVTILIFFLFLL
jgi:hypothetical protein